MSGTTLRKSLLVMELNGSIEDAYVGIESPRKLSQVQFELQDNGQLVPTPSRAYLTNEKKLYGVDLVLIFPWRSNGEEKSPEDFTCERFVSLLMGIRREKSAREGKLVIDPLKRVLRTTRCFLDDNGHYDADLKQAMEQEDDQQQLLLAEKRFLEQEYRRFTGTTERVSEEKFCELVATAISRRVQLACGLTTRMFFSCDHDEIIMTIKADDTDLRVEADRTNYPVQVSNKPFATIHNQKIEIVRREFSEETRDKVYDQAIELLERTRGHAKGSHVPEMDPLLVTDGETYHPRLYESLRMYGHTEEADGVFTPELYNDPRGNISMWRRFLNSLNYISYDPMTYFAPYVDYRSEAQFQFFYRRYPLDWGEPKQETLFTQRDRIRLAASIVERHLGIEALQVAGYLVSEMFSLHDQEALQDLKRNWALNWTMFTQPIHKIRMYFGEKVGLYFAWLEFYTKMLIIPSFAGIIAEIAVYVFKGEKYRTTRGYILIAFAGSIVAWAALFSELWKRKNHIYNTLWGSHLSRQDRRPRARFQGIKRLNPVNDIEETTYENRAARRRAFVVSWMVVFFMICIVIVALVGFFYGKHWINQKRQPTDDSVAGTIHDNPTVFTQLVSVLNAIQILLLNMVYRGVAKKLNDWENHRTEVQYEKFLVQKVFLFQFCNSFASFFYIAFAKKKVEDQCIDGDCLNELRNQLIVLFVIRIVVGNTLEVLVPYLKYRYSVYAEQKAVQKEKRKTAVDGIVQRQKHNYVEQQAKLNPYESNESFEDYNEMVIQFGFITLFVVAFPLTPLLALANNIAEVHVDAVKLCIGHRRPFPFTAKNIGAWADIIRILTFLSLVTNSALILWTSDFFSSSDNKSDNKVKAIIFFVTIQVCFLVAITIEHLVHDVPHQLELLLGRHEYIIATVFKGLEEGDDSKLREIAEKLDLQIYSNEQWEEPEVVPPTPPQPFS